MSNGITAFRIYKSSKTNSHKKGRPARDETGIPSFETGLHSRTGSWCRRHQEEEVAPQRQSVSPSGASPLRWRLGARAPASAGQGTEQPTMQANPARSCFSAPEVRDRNRGEACLRERRGKEVVRRPLASQARPGWMTGHCIYYLLGVATCASLFHPPWKTTGRNRFVRLPGKRLFPREREKKSVVVFEFFAV